MLTLSKEWPGVLWEAWPVCTEDHAKKVYLASSVRTCSVAVTACVIILRSSGLTPEIDLLIVALGLTPTRGSQRRSHDVCSRGSEIQTPLENSGSKRNTRCRVNCGNEEE
ncbi:unnamed protein product [Sphacelaria rigidula]